MPRWAQRFGAVTVGLVAAVAWAGAAFAHVEVEADPDVAGSPDAVVTFTAEAESASAGISSVQIVLPTGITPQDVALNKAPAGWTFTAGADGYTVKGAALPQGEEAVHSIIVTRLPNMDQLVFKTLVTYSDGQIDRWIEEKSTANPNPENPAPVLTLKPGPSDNSMPTTPPPATVTSTPTPASSAGTDGGSAWIWWVVGGVVVLGGIGFALSRRRRNAA